MLRRPAAKSSDKGSDRSSSPSPPPPLVSSSNTTLSDYLEPITKVLLVLLLLIILILVILIFAPKPNTKLPPGPDIETIPFDIGSATKATYSAFIETIHDKLGYSAVYFSIPMLPAPSHPPTYVYVELKSTKGNSITLGIDKNNIYVLGYSDVYQGKPRARFFDDTSAHAKDTLFPEARKAGRSKVTGYTAQYDAIEAKAGRTRTQVGLGIKRLDDQIDKLFGKNEKDKDFVRTQAEFFLMAIQTVSEAVRFKYIEDQIEKKFPENFTPDKKVICLEENWSRVSKAFKNADPQTGEIPQKYIDLLRLCDPDGHEWKITNVHEITKDMGLLNYIA